MRITLSSKQYTMLRLIKQKKVFSQEEAATYLQPTFGSMARRAYLVTEHTSDGVVFKATQAAAAAVAQFENEEIYRTGKSTALSQFLERYIKKSERVRRVAS